MKNLSHEPLVSASLNKPYRFYFLDSTRHVQNRHDFYAADDEAAVQKALNMLNASPYALGEIWVGKQRIFELEKSSARCSGHVG